LSEVADARAGRLDDRVIARLDRSDAIRALKPKEREALYLFGLGYSYDEIAQLTQATYTAVNRRITEGRAALRKHPA
jgi:DNA-directed RNA polymerase specialized sigma24 family protein